MAARQKTTLIDTTYAMLKSGLFLVLIILSIQLLSIECSAQTDQLVSVFHTRHVIKSQVLGQDRTVLVRVPAHYESPDRKFPVVYMLDAHAPQNAMMAGIMDQQAWGGVMPEAILVGIQNVDRLLDMTPTTTERAGSGGAQKFLRFIETEVVPLIDKNYRTQPYRILAGHSLAGLFVVYSLVERPDLFNAYIAASPVLDWDHNFVIKRAETLFQQDRDWKKRMFIGLGDEPDYLDGFNAFRALLKRAKPKGFEYDIQQFKTENHGSGVLPIYYAGLRKVFEDWVAPRSGSLNDLEDHYRKLSTRYGYVILPPEEMMNQVGYVLLRSDRLEEAITAFKKNADNYPNSPNVYDSLGEAYEKAGRLKLARDNYEKGYKLAETHNDTQLARIVRANYERVSVKLK